MESCGPSSDSFLVDSSPLLSKSGGGRIKLELNNAKSQLELNNTNSQLELNNAKSQLTWKFGRTKSELKTKLELNNTKSQLKRKFPRMQPKFPKLKSNETKMKVTTKPNKSKVSLETNLIKTVQKSVNKEMRTKQTCLVYQFQNLKQRRKHHSLLCYGKDARRFVETNNIHSLTSEPRWRKFFNGYNSTICCMSLFLPCDESTQLIQTVNSIQLTDVV